MLRLVSLERRAHHKPNELSGGELLLIKGSRGVHLALLVEQLENRPA